MEYITGIALIIIVINVIIKVFSKSTRKGSLTEDEKFDFLNRK